MNHDLLIQLRLLLQPQLELHQLELHELVQLVQLLQLLQIKTRPCLSRISFLNCPHICVILTHNLLSALMMNPCHLFPISLNLLHMITLNLYRVSCCLYRIFRATCSTFLSIYFPCCPISSIMIHPIFLIMSPFHTF